MSILAGKKINKAGFAVDSHGIIYGKLVEGDAKRLVGRMCGKEGQVFSEGGDVVGRVELVPESEREGSKEGPFAGFESAIVTKEGTVRNGPDGDVIGRLIEGGLHTAARLLIETRLTPKQKLLNYTESVLMRMEMLSIRTVIL